jgi:ferritin-like metal-binding protein YciE
MATVQDNLLDWLRDAHAMEQQAENMLEAQVERLENYPQLRTRIQQHLEETHQQRAQLETCLQRLGSSPSTLKDISAKVMAFGQGMAGMVMSDEVVKGAMSGYVFENMEIAAYTVLIEAARVAGDAETQRVCESILQQEVAMSDWLRGHLPELTQAFLVRSDAPGVEAKR